ncbi:T9SS type A sorting domain-containing protein [bacterium]|nr:T9SS type A sorting domain-containing protein [bacterium]
MDFLGFMAESTARHLWTVSLQVTVLVAVIWIVDRLSFRASSLFRYWLWLIVLARLCIPVNLDIPGGIRWIVKYAAHNGILTDNGFPGRAWMSDSFGAVAFPFIPESSFPAHWYTSAGFVWMAVCGMVAVSIVFRIYHIRKFSGTWIRAGRTDLCALLDTLRHSLRVRQTVSLYSFEDEAAAVPAVIGIMKPRILLPRVIVETWELTDIEPVLLHELAHIKRFDLMVNCLQMIVQAVYFFHPLVWFVNRRLRYFREELCDDTAVRYLVSGRKHYTMSMLRVMEETCRMPVPGYIGIGFSERNSTISERIKRIMRKDYTPYTSLTLLSVFMLFIVTAVSFTLSCASAGKESVKIEGIVLARTDGSPGQEMVLKQNYPNPVNTSTTFIFSLPKSGHTALAVYDVKGNEIAVLVDKELSEGEYTVKWNVGKLKSGVYFYRLKSGSGEIVKKMTVISS